MRQKRLQELEAQMSDFSQKMEELKIKEQTDKLQVQKLYQEIEASILSAEFCCYTDLVH